MKTKLFNTKVSVNGKYLGNRTWSGIQIDVAWDKFDYNSSNHSLWALDSVGNLQYRSSFNDYAGRYNKDDVGLTDYVFDMEIEPAGPGNYEVGFAFRFRDRYGFYYLTMNGGYQNWQGNNIRLKKVSGATHSILKEVAHPTFTTGTTYKFKCEVSGGRIKIWLNDTLIIDFIDNFPILNGAWGPWVKGQEFTKFKGIMGKSNTYFSTNFMLPENSVTNEMYDPPTAKLIDPRGIGEIADPYVVALLSTRGYETYTISTYIIGSDNGGVKVLLDKTDNKLSTTDPLSKIYAYYVLPTTPPISPSNLTVTDVGIDRATYLWTDNSTEEDGFVLLDAFNNIIATLPENTTTFTEVGLLEDTLYERKVAAFNVAGQSGQTNLVKFTTKQTIPDTPLNFEGIATSDTEIVWTWRDVFNENQYEIIAWDAEGNVHVVAVLDKNVTTFVETGLNPSTEYTRAVRAINLAGTSGESLPYTVTTMAELPEAPFDSPANFYGVGVSDHSIFWTWIDTCGNEAGFEIQDENDTLIAILPPNSTNFEELGLKASTTYKRRIRAFNEGGTGPWTEFALATTMETGLNYTDRPVAPINLNGLVLSKTEAVLTWEYNNHPVFPAFGFKLYDFDDNLIAALPLDVFEYNMADLQPNRTYRFYIVAYNENGDSPKSNIVTLVTPHGSNILVPDNELDELEDPLEGVIYDKETPETGKIKAFQSGIGDNLHLRVKKPERNVMDSEEFTYDTYIKAFYDVYGIWHHQQEFYYKVKCYGYNSSDHKFYTDETAWIRAVVNGADDTADGKKLFETMLSMDVPSEIINVKYGIEVVDLQGNPIPKFDSLAPNAGVRWTVSEGVDGDIDSAPGSTVISRKDIFDTWGRFSHGWGGAQPASATELASWIYNEADESIRSTINSSTYIGFYSPDLSDNYDFDVAFKVEQPPGQFEDNDRIGVIIAFQKDENGTEHTLSAIRNNDSPSFTWSIIYNYSQPNQKVIADASPLIKQTGAWCKTPKGSRIKVVRNNDQIEAWTSQSDSQELVEEAKLVVDLSSDPVLDIFRAPSAYGISAHSQQYINFYSINMANFSASFEAGVNATLVAWSDEHSTKNVRKTWRSAKNRGRKRVIQGRETIRFTDHIQRPDTDLSWQDMSKKYKLYGYTLIAESNNPNVYMYQDVETTDFFPVGKDSIEIVLIAKIINLGQTAWVPEVHNGYYYLNSMEHFLMTEDEVFPKNADENKSLWLDFNYTIKARGKRLFGDTHFSFADNTKEQFLLGTMTPGVEVNIFNDTLTLSESANEGVFTSRIMNFEQVVEKWDALSISQDMKQIENGATLKVELGVVSPNGSLDFWYPQVIGEPITLPEDVSAKRVAYRLTMTSKMYKHFFTKSYHHANPFLQQGLPGSDKIIIENNTIRIDKPESNTVARYVSAAMDFGDFIGDMGMINLGVYLGENSKIRVFTASSNSLSNDFANPTAEAPWIPAELISQDGENFVYRNRSIHKRYVSLIIEMTRGEIKLPSGIKDYSTPAVYDISLEPNLYNNINAAPVISVVSIGGSYSAGFVYEDYNVSLAGELNTDGYEHDVSTDNVEDLVLDYLAELGIENINQLKFEHYELLWDKTYPIELTANTNGLSNIKGTALENTGTRVKRESVMYISKETDDIILTPVPQSGTPIIVKNARNQLLRQVHFRDEYGEPTLMNVEYAVTNESPYVFLEHYFVDPESLRVWIDVNRDGNMMQIYNCKVAENRLVLPDKYEPGMQIKIHYRIKESYCVDYNYSPNQDLCRLQFHMDYHTDYKETRRVFVRYETNKESAYYRANELNLNPLKTDLNHGFIYLTDVVEVPYKIDVDVTPKQLYKNRPDTVTINIRVLDETGNPVTDQIINLSPSEGIIRMKSRRTDHNGLVSAILMTPQGTGADEIIINARTVASTAAQQISKDIIIKLVQEKFNNEIAIILSKESVKRNSTLPIKLVAMGPNDERLSNQHITVTANKGHLTPNSGNTNGSGEFFTFYQSPTEDSAEDELVLITAEYVDADMNLIREQAIVNVLNTNAIEVK